MRLDQQRLAPTALYGVLPLVLAAAAVVPWFLDRWWAATVLPPGGVAVAWFAWHYRRTSRWIALPGLVACLALTVILVLVVVYAIVAPGGD
jgi:hypothetical protein